MSPEEHGLRLGGRCFGQSSEQINDSRLDGMSGSLPPVPARDVDTTDCFDTAYDLVDYPALANLLRERQRILRRSDCERPELSSAIEDALQHASSLSPSTAKELLHEFFDWQRSGPVDSSLILSDVVLSEAYLNEVGTYDHILKLVPTLIRTGALDGGSVYDVLRYSEEDLRRCRVSTAKLRLVEACAAISAGLALPQTFSGPILTFVGWRWLQESSVTKSVTNFTRGYLLEARYAHGALATGEEPSLGRILGALLPAQPTPEQRLISEGFMTARILRPVATPSIEIHNLFRRQASQPVSFLGGSFDLTSSAPAQAAREQLEKLNLQSFGSLAIDYWQSHVNNGRFAKVFDALQQCYDEWNQWCRRCCQKKMIELVHAQRILNQLSSATT